MGEPLSRQKTGRVGGQILAFVIAYNFAKHLKALRWRPRNRTICDAWTNDPTIFKINPHHLIARPNA